MSGARDAGADAGSARVGFRDVLRVRSFLALYAAETQSILGDQLARVALSVLVYERTGSTAETALIYALTFLPAIAGGALLSGLADRYPRRLVMVGCDVLRCAMLAAMALPEVPIGGLFGLLVLTVFLGPAFTSAEVSMIADLLDAEEYRVATGLRMITNQIAQVAGFAVGGAVVAALNPRWALLLDAVTYACSALVIAIAARLPRAGTHRAQPAAGELVSFATCVRDLFADRHLRSLVGLSWLAGFFVVPEGLAAPYAHQIGGSTAAVGYLLTSIPLGSVIGAYVVLRLIPQARRTRAIGPMALLSGLPLLACAVAPGVLWSMAAWFAAGLFAAYQLDVMTRIVQFTPAERRGRVVGILGATLIGAQGAGLIVFGVLAGALAPGTAIALAGAVGAVGAVFGWIGLARSAGDESTPGGEWTAAGPSRSDTHTASESAQYNAELTQAPRHLNG